MIPQTFGVAILDAHTRLAPLETDDAHLLTAALSTANVDLVLHLLKEERNLVMQPWVFSVRGQVSPAISSPLLLLDHDDDDTTIPPSIIHAAAATTTKTTTIGTQ
jgi:hypothetical protein